MNPLREGLASRPMPQPCNVVIFGASGDLTFRKLIPAIYNIAADGDLPAALNVVGFARREKTDAEFRAELEANVRKFSRQGVNDELWKSFAERLFYHRSEFGDSTGYQTLAAKLDRLDTERNTHGNRLFYLSVAPSEFPGILQKLAEAGLNKAKEGAWTRVIVEKPFGKDLASARALNQVVNEVFRECDTFRIDHYLGKETAQNIMVLRFANAIFEPIWNQRYIDHVQITGAEPLGVEGRGPYYETAGALRDMVQNHLLQLLSLVAMEPPVELTADAIRDEKVKVIRSLRALSPDDVRRDVVRGQYNAGAIGGNEVVGYRQEERVDPQSMTETYVALKVHVDNWRWADVPFYVRFGKRLAKSGTEIAVQFKDVPGVLFNRDRKVGPNVLVIRIQPDEGISLRIQAKLPGAAVRIEPVKMDFAYGTSFGKASPEAYERLLLDAMSGDATLFARRDEVEYAWEFVDRIENAWHPPEDEPPPLHPYPAGSWGPSEADALLERDGRTWRRM